jgi:hypothetical protein
VISEKRPMSTASRHVVGERRFDVGKGRELRPMTKQPSVVQRSTRLTDRVDSVSSMMLRSAARTVTLVLPASCEAKRKVPQGVMAVVPAGRPS